MSSGPHILNRDQRRALEAQGVEYDEWINVKEYWAPKFKHRPVTRGEFGAILVHYHKQQRWRARLKTWTLSQRWVVWFLRVALGMQIKLSPSSVPQEEENAAGKP